MFANHRLSDPWGRRHRRAGRLCRQRAAALEPIIDQHLVNIPPQFFKVYGLGDMYSPKHVTMTEEQRY